MDIEWAKDSRTGEMFIVQARPETVQSQRQAGLVKTYRLKERIGAGQRPQRRRRDRRRTSASREGGAKAGGALVVYSLSRLARSTKDTIAIAEQLDRAGADLVGLSERIDTTSAAGRMVFRMLAVLAEFERDLVSERTATAMAQKRSKQERVGTIPFGFTLAPDAIHLVESAEEQAIIRAIRASDGGQDVPGRCPASERPACPVQDRPKMAPPSCPQRL